MKRIDLFCASQASTAICSSIDQRSMVRHGMRPVDHQTRSLRGRHKTTPQVPCSSQLPLSPKPYNEKRRKSSVKQADTTSRRSSSTRNDSSSGSPPGSSRYLLSDTPFFDLLAESERASALVPFTQQSVRPKHVSSHHSPVLRKSSSSTHSHNQVVVLWVSLHCKGCEGKVRKHISKMEGVTSFSIDLATKKVTVIGDVTPLGVLSSVSKVKNAQFWPSPSSYTPMVELS